MCSLFRTVTIETGLCSLTVLSLPLICQETFYRSQNSFVKFWSYRKCKTKREKETSIGRWENIKYVQYVLKTLDLKTFLLLESITHYNYDCLEYYISIFTDGMGILKLKLCKSSEILIQVFQTAVGKSFLLLSYTQARSKLLSKIEKKIHKRLPGLHNICFF